MKLTVMKVICLLTLLGGIFVLGIIFEIKEAQLIQDQAIGLWPKQSDGSLNLRLPGVIAGALMVLLGGYGLLPRLPRRKDKVITFRSSQGEITVQLKPVRKVLLKVMRKMPEIYSIKIAVKPDADKRRASITADVVLKNCATLGARRCARMVADCLAATARDVLALDDLSAIRVNIKGVHVNIGATGRQMREQVAMGMEEAEESAAYALAHPPVASVTLDEHSTDNRPVGTVEAQEVSDVPESTDTGASEATENAPEPETTDNSEEDEEVSAEVVSDDAEAEPVSDSEAEQAPETLLPPVQNVDDVPLCVPLEEEVPEAQPAEDADETSQPEMNDEDDRWR